MQFLHYIFSNLLSRLLNRACINAYGSYGSEKFVNRSRNEGLRLIMQASVSCGDKSSFTDQDTLIKQSIMLKGYWDLQNDLSINLLVISVKS